MRIHLYPHNRPVSSKVARIELKVQRADKHFHDLRVNLDAFYKVLQTEKSKFLVREVEPVSGDKIFKIVTVPEVPPMISVIAGDILFNLRSALDHLAFQLVIANPAVTSKKDIFFPFGESEADYMASERRSVIETFANTAVKRIDALKPYKGGNDILWRLSRLNNIDKHRLLITTSMRFKHRTTTPADYARMCATIGKGTDPGGILSGIRHTNFGGPIEPLKVGDIVYRKPKGTKQNQQLEFSFEVGIHEPKVMNCESLGESLYMMIKTVQNLVVPKLADLL
jgi:hypothetical protein